MRVETPPCPDVDWRFLLDDIEIPGDGRLGASGRRDLGAGDPVVIWDDPPRGAIESVASDGRDVTLVVRTSTRRSGRHVRAALADAGFVSRTYGCWPSNAAPSLFVDLEGRAAALAAVGTVKNVHRRRFGRLGVRLGLGPTIFRHRTFVARRSSAVVPLPAIVAFGDGAHDASMTLLAPKFGSSRHVIALVNDATGERRVVKTPRVPTDDVQISRESAGLTSVASRRHDAPTLVADTIVQGQRWLVQSHVDGRPLTRGDVRRDPVEWFDRCRAWLDAMPTCPATPPGSDGRLERLLVPAVSEVRTLLGTSADRLVPDAEWAIAELRDVALPVVAEHGDFRPPNVIVTPSSGVAAVDWELAEPHGLPLYDLLFLHAYVVDVVPDRRRELDAIVDGAARTLGLGPTMVDALYVAMLVRQLANSSIRGIAGGSRPWTEVDVARAWLDRIELGPTRPGEAR